MIDFFTWGTPNGYKVAIALEELALPYRVTAVNIGRGDQFKPEFLTVNPNNKIPAIVDRDGPNGQPLALFESGAILFYLAEKTGELLPPTPAGRYAAMQWLMFQMGGVGPMLGQVHHFRQYAPEKIQYAIERYTKEANRLYAVLDKRLGEEEYLAGPYSIADVATFPWLRAPEKQGVELAQYPHVARWRDAIAKRPAVVKGLTVPEASTQPLDPAAKEMLFGNTQYQRR